MADKETSRLRKKMRIIILAISVAILGFAFVADWVGLSDPGSFSKGQMLLVATSVVLAVASMLGHRIVALYKSLALLILNTVVAFIIMELGAALILKAMSLFPTAPELTPQLPYYYAQEWGAEYWHEDAIAASNRYEPWVVWRRRAFSGKTINVNQEGIRLTPGADCSQNCYKVFAFGGSTMWGTGAPDWGTIPAYLQAKLDSLINRPVCVVNFGEAAYVSTQGVIELLKQLQSGNVPDLVIFYDGFNDVAAIMQSGRPGWHQNASDIAARFKGGSSTPPEISLLNRLNSVSLLKRLLPKKDPGQQRESAYVDQGLEPDSLAFSTVRAYISNYEIVEALAHKYGFQYHFFWQPVILLTKKPLTSEELVLKAEIAKTATVRLFSACYQHLEQEARDYPNLHYIAHVYDDESSQLWIDTVHVMPLGNQLVADEILKVIKNSVIRFRRKTSEE